MQQVAANRIAFQWQLELSTRAKAPVIKDISADSITFAHSVTHGLLQQLGPGQFALRVARGQIRIHTPSAWYPVDKSVGLVTEACLEWASDAERAAFARDLLLARQSELFSPAGV